MINKWLLEEKRDLFIRDLVENFFEAKVFFDKFYKKYKQGGSISFKEMDYWVGTEVKKGQLWNLKDECHALFRDSKPEIGLCEHLFDWAFGSIFHECMKLKEDIYQIEAYKPVYLQFKQTSQVTAEVRETIKEIHLVIDKIEKDLASMLEGINRLFSEAAAQLKKLFSNYAKNGLLVRFLLENRKLTETVFGENAFQEIFSSMYPDGLESAYFVAGISYLKGCWYKEAVGEFKKVLEINPQNIKAKSEMDKAKSEILT